MKEPYIQWREDGEENETTDKIDKQLDELQKEAEKSSVVYYPQAQEENEYRYISPAWLDAIAEGLTAGAVKHPGETWRLIPSQEHLARALRHINLYRMGDRSEPHIINASMRLMMAFETAGADREKWEGLMNDYERGRLND